MYLSLLVVEAGDVPNRPRPGRMWISNPYRVHQRLCMAFPDAPCLAEEGPKAALHLKRDEQNGVLFRIEANNPIRPGILVQSAQKPDWEKAFRNAGFLLFAPPQVKEFNPQFLVGEKYRFLLRANPTEKRALPREDGKPRENKARFGLKTDEERIAWLHRKAGAGGFSVLADQLTMLAARPRVSHRSRAIDPNPHTHLAVDFTGILKVMDTDKLRDTLVHGIGSAKGYGFGLLSLAPVKP